MQFFATNEKSLDGTFQIELSSFEEESLEDALFYLSMGLSRVVIEFITECCSDIKQANALREVLREMSDDLISDYINNGTLEEILEKRTEAGLYSWMESVFYDWLKTLNITKEEFEKQFSDSKTLTMKPIALGEKILIFLTNDDPNDEKRLLIREFSRDIINDREAFEREVSFAYIIAVCGGDLLMNEENPIREKYCVCDNTLMDNIRKLI